MICVPKTLFERALNIDLLYSKMIAQSETPEYDGGGKSDEATLATIKHFYEIKGTEAFCSYMEGTAKERSQFNQFCKRVLDLK